MLAELVQRARSKGWLRSRLVHFFLRRTRVLVGLREMPKFIIVLLMARMRDLWWTVGKELEQAGRLETAGEVFFLRSEEHTSELQSPCNLVCRLLLEKKKPLR